MKRLLLLACLSAAPLAAPVTAAQTGSSDYDALVKTHAAAYCVPEALVHRVILRESRYQPQLVGRGGTIGLMQIKLGTARGLGYTGDAAGLHDPATNLKYGIKYLAGAYRAAHADHARTLHLYTVGYYDVVKRQRLEFAASPWLDASGNPQAPLPGPGKPAIRIQRANPR
jgi:soluble lytic murein transglycosylase-like protein